MDKVIYYKTLTFFLFYQLAQCWNVFYMESTWLAAVGMKGKLKKKRLNLSPQEI